MKPDKKVLESAVLGLALVLVTTYTAVAAPKQEAAGDSQMRVTSNGTAGAASQLVSGLDDTQTASIEKTDVAEPPDGKCGRILKCSYGAKRGSSFGRKTPQGRCS